MLFWRPLIWFDKLTMSGGGMPHRWMPVYTGMTGEGGALGEGQFVLVL